MEIQRRGGEEGGGKAGVFARVGRRPTCKSFRMAREGNFDGGRVFGLSILMLLIKPETALGASGIYKRMQTGKHV